MALSLGGVYLHSVLTDVDTPHVAADVFASLEKISDTTLTAAATTHQITSLDLATDELYFFIAQIKNVAALAGTHSLYCNSDATATNYYEQYGHFDNAAVAGSRQNNGILMYLTAAREGMFWMWIRRTVDGYPTAQVIAVPGGTGLEILNRSWMHNDTTNLTSLEFTTDQANGIGIGSQFTLYKISR